MVKAENRRKLPGRFRTFRHFYHLWSNKIEFFFFFAFNAWIHLNYLDFFVHFVIFTISDLTKSNFSSSSPSMLEHILNLSYFSLSKWFTTRSRISCNFPETMLTSLYVNDTNVISPVWSFSLYWYLPKIYLFKVNNRNTRKRFEIWSKLTIKTPVNVIDVILVFLLTLNIIHVFL